MDAMTAEAIGYLIILVGMLVGFAVLSYKYHNDKGRMSDEWLERNK